MQHVFLLLQIQKTIFHSTTIFFFFFLIPFWARAIFYFSFFFHFSLIFWYSVFVSWKLTGTVRANPFRRVPESSLYTCICIRTPLSPFPWPQNRNDKRFNLHSARILLLVCRVSFFSEKERERERGGDKEERRETISRAGKLKINNRRKM